jgi:hypothetical protein
MTVSQLIQALQKFDPDSPVYAEGGNGAAVEDMALIDEVVKVFEYQMRPGGYTQVASQTGLDNVFIENGAPYSIREIPFIMHEG